MGRSRTREVNVVLPFGQEVRIADAPCSETLQNLTITVAPSTGGVALPAGAGNLVCSLFYGGGWDQDAVVYGPTLDTGVQQGASVNLAAASALPQRIFTDANHLPADRWRDGATVRENYGLARALHLYNNIGAGTTVVCKVIFTTETVSDAV